jgi:hypothetical protein
MVQFILKSSDPHLVGIGFCHGFLIRYMSVSDIHLTLCDKVLYDMSGSSFLNILLPETVMIHNHGSSYGLRVCKQVLSKSN